MNKYEIVQYAIAGLIPGAGIFACAYFLGYVIRGRIEKLRSKTKEVKSDTKCNTRNNNRCSHKELLAKKKKRQRKIKHA